MPCMNASATLTSIREVGHYLQQADRESLIRLIPASIVNAFVAFLSS